jgi:hypothetical protein
MGMTNFQHALKKKFSALTGQLVDLRANIDRIRREQAKLPELEARIPELEALIDSAAMLLRDVDGKWEPEQTPPIKPWTHGLPVPFGSCGRRGMEVLRNADQPMTVREIATEVLRQVGNDTPDTKILRRTQGAIEASLRKHRDRSVTSSGKYPAQWKSIVKREMPFDL